MDIIIKEFPELNNYQIKQFSAFENLYSYWNDKINVISRQDIDNIYLRHVLHSLAIAKFIKFKDKTTILDLGTGGGFPGIPLSIIFPNCNFILVDSTKKKIDVVNAIVKELGIKNINSVWARAENLNYKYDFLVTRAVAKMPKIINWSTGNFNRKSKNEISNGIIALKGGNVASELLDIKEKRILDIKNIFDFPYFTDKKIIYVPCNLSNT